MLNGSRYPSTCPPRGKLLAIRPAAANAICSHTQTNAWCDVVRRSVLSPASLRLPRSGLVQKYVPKQWDRLVGSRSGCGSSGTALHVCSTPRRRATPRCCRVHHIATRLIAVTTPHAASRIGQESASCCQSACCTANFNWQRCVIVECESGLRLEYDAERTGRFVGGDWECFGRVFDREPMRDQ